MLQIGQELFWVGSQRHSPNGIVTVTKVGRKWATLSNDHRIDLETHRADGGGYQSPGRTYPSEAAYVAEQITKLNKLKERMGWTAPKGVKIQDVYEAARLLGLPMEAA